MYLDLLRVRGLDASAPFQLAGLNALYNTAPGIKDGELPEAGEPLSIEAFDVSLWDLQSERIEAQNLFIESVAEAFRAKRKHLPQTINIWESLKEESAQWFAGLFVRMLLAKFGAGAVASSVSGEIAEFLTGLVMDVYNHLKNAYHEGLKLCKTMQMQNEALLKIDPTWENYDRRDRQLDRNIKELNNLIEYAETLEAQAMRFQENEWDEQQTQALIDQALQDWTLDAGGVRVHAHAKLIDR